ncbi:MAG: hypothetical protein FD145_273 [Candidatus Saganbacteria bacterium]|uniref:Nucleotidyl transferase AbiEii/AbiGii toxin family protein n=1 Tax=Candidatus Saganbacteria bacterium TaxID=2575572 RepID=A0A833P0H3_UNCSA|nr:MAG: hypothetical protein FD145_273 [Candidatus Saganbacteria bacterium]
MVLNMTEKHLEILDKKRKEILPLFKDFKDRFYLAAGTGLALQLGHRDSIDFDFFTNKVFNPEDLLREIREIFNGYSIEVIQASNKTLNLVVADEIKVSFFCIKENLLRPCLDFGVFNIADPMDIACMKICALLRAEFKDYVDLYYIFKKTSLKEIIENCKKKYTSFDAAVYLKALVSFDDINYTEILFTKGNKVALPVIKKDFEKRVKGYLLETSSI